MKYLISCAAALSLTFFAVPALAQAGADIAPIMSICTDVIEREYNGDQSRRNQCVNGVTEFLTGLGAPSAAVDPTISELVIALSELYREDDDCKIADTELAEAIAAAGALMADETVRADLIGISNQIQSCDFEPTAAINDELAS